MPRLPPVAILLGLASLLPLLACAAGAVWLPEEKGAAYLAALIAYGAVSLSFLGAVQWGFALVVGPGRDASRRLLLGTVPPALAWLAWLASVSTGPVSALVLLLLGFAGTLGVETSAWRHGRMPTGYMWLRWGLGIVWIGILGAVTLVFLFRNNPIN